MICHGYRRHAPPPLHGAIRIEFYVNFAAAIGSYNAIIGIFLSPRTRGRILALNRTLSGLPKPEPVLRDPKPMPFKAVRRHQYWSADIRYLDHGLGDCKVSSVTILDNDSRAVLASGRSRTRDLGTFLMVLFMAKGTPPGWGHSSMEHPRG